MVTATPNAAQLPVGTVVTSGDTFPIGTTTVECTATDNAGNTDMCSFMITVQDTTPPSVSAFARRSLLFLPRNGLINALITKFISDICDPMPTVEVEVYSNQPDTGAPFTPDAMVLGMDLQIRAEVDLTSPDPGRVFLIIVTATDAAGNVGRDCTWVIVPKTATVFDVIGARNIAVAAEADCDATGMIPAGWFPILSPPVAFP